MTKAVMVPGDETDRAPAIETAADGEGAAGSSTTPASETDEKRPKENTDNAIPVS